ncbi:MAG: ABC transporter ATP-binding protein [Pseudomonadota bacterium]
MMTPAVHIQDLTKEFSTDFWKPKSRVLEGLTLSVREGGIFGLVGPNGAGKTTTIKILLGLLRPTSGSARIFGHSVSEIGFKKDVGYLPENAYYYEFLRAREILDFYGRLFGLSRSERARRTEELLGLVGLSKDRDLKLRFFSKGMFQRIGIAQALVNDPKLVILDEPMSGLDPIGRKEMRDIILKLAEQGKTVFFSSHILSDVEAICDDVAILVRGKLKASGSLGELVRSGVKSMEIVFEGSGPASHPEKWEGRVSLRVVGRQFVLSTRESELLPEILSWGSQKGFALVSVVPQRESLEDLFMEHVGAAS